MEATTQTDNKKRKSALQEFTIFYEHVNDNRSGRQIRTPRLTKTKQGGT